MRPIRVLHYMATNFGMTGVETFILQLCEAQKRAGLHPTITLELEGREEVATRAAAMQVGVENFPAKSRAEERLPRKFASARLRMRRIQALVELLRDAEVLHMHAVGIVGLDALVAAFVAKKPVVITHHATLTWFAPMRSRMSDATFWLEKRLASFVVMPYAAAAEELVASGVAAERTVVVPFCVDEQRFDGTAARPGPGELRLIMAARMLEGKGHEDLLAAMATLCPRYPGLNLVLVGDGPTRSRVEAEIEGLGLGAAVEVRGQVDHNEMPALMRTAHVIVLPSYMPGETFPICLLEGMAVGLPAIGSRGFGIPDIIDDGQTGFVVEPKDPAGLASAIERFLKDPVLLASASRKATERIRLRFTASAVAAEYSGL
jgi:glycosyltransferase involved in cell wall biosynthesis